MDNGLFTTLCAATLVAAATYIGANIRRLSVSLPPGPKADPLIGHLRCFPSANQEIVFHEWAQQYGDVIHLNILGRSMIVLGSREAAVDLLEKRSSLYSDRPRLIIYELMGWDPDLVIMPYGSQFRKHRKLLGPALSPQACVPMQDTQLENVLLLIDGLIKSRGHNLFPLLSRFTTANIMRIAYGHQILSDDDVYISMLTQTMRAVRECGAIGTTPVDILPFLRYMPSWFPGTYYANVARHWRWAVRKLYDYPYDTVVQQMKDGTAERSFVYNQLATVNSRDLSEEEIDDIKGAAAIFYAAGADTTLSALCNFFIAMVLHPECQRLGQEEVDKVVGRDRLPTFKDRDSLTYVECIVQEVLRWGRIIPLGVPHRSTEDDIYRGMFIPKGSYVFANIAGISLDENRYKDPKTFNPSRFLPKSQGGNEEPPFSDVFGFGRRICPGRHLALGTLFISVATILSTLNISKAKDEDGREITPKVDYATGVVHQVKPFPCVITPRSANVGMLVSEAVNAEM